MSEDSKTTGRPDPAARRPHLSERSKIASFIVMDAMQRAAAREAAGERVIHMEVGQPGTPAPRLAREAVFRALDRDPLGYTLALGHPALREGIAGLYRRWYGLDLSPERVVVTTGSSGGFLLAFLSLFDAGDRVALPSPGYPCYRQILAALGCEPVMVETGPETRWMPDRAALERLLAEGSLAGLLVASPNNPTGTMLSSEALGSLTSLCRERGIAFVSDEIYHGLTYGAPAATALAVMDEAVVINSFSKYFSMTGWRVGWMVVPEAMVRTVERLAQNLFIAAPAVSQAAALGALGAVDELEANRAVYAVNRKLLLDGLPAAGFDSIVPADGAFYLYCDVSGMTGDSLAFAAAMLDETGVAATPGLDFDPARGHRYLRFSYAGETAAMAEAVDRLRGWQRLVR
jgi:aspartate/methionine/tyrosine aminotransferase